MKRSERDEFLTHCTVSRETVQALDRYAEMLAEWNQRFNLVAESTISHIWNRHFLDSAQLMRHMPGGAKTLADLGSGAGFPGLVLSILGVPEVHLIESTGKKAAFLGAVIEELNLGATVHQDRIENIRGFKADVITARALKPLPELLKLAKPLMGNNYIGIFLKGKSLQDELTESNRWWTFDCETFQSLSDHSGSVLIIRGLKSKNVPERKHSKRKN